MFWLAAQTRCRLLVLSQSIKPKYLKVGYLKRDGKKQAVIVIQAEQVQSEKIIGAKLLNGQDIAGFMKDFELLGNHQPN